MRLLPRQPGGHVTVPLAHGWARLRPLRRGETAPLLAVFDGLSPGSRADRYLTGMATLPARMLGTLVDLDGCARVAWIASVDGRPAGIGRYVRSGPATVEVAFEVADAYQGQGLGTALLDAITTVAEANGVRRLRATVLATNAPARRLMARAGVPLSFDDGVLEGEADLRLLDAPRVDRRAVLALAGRHSRPQGERVPCPQAMQALGMP